MKIRGARCREWRGRGTGGFTLAETMVAASILMLILAGLMSVFTMSMQAWKEGSRDLSLQATGRLIIEKIVRGPGGRFGLREAGERDVTIDADGRGISFLVDKNTPPTYGDFDDTQVRIYLDENAVMYDPSTGETGDEMLLVRLRQVEDMQFELADKAVNVDLWLRETSKTTHDSQVKLRTKVYLRKSENADTET